MTSSPPLTAVRTRRVENGAASLGAADRFRQVVEAAPNAMVMTDHSGQIVMVNTEAERVFGYTRVELLGQPMTMLMPERFRSSHLARRAAYFGTPKSLPVHDIYSLRKDESEFPIEVFLSHIDTDDGTMVLAAIVDISERKQAEQDRERYTEELRRSNAELAEFAHLVSHDLKAPLRAIQNLARWIAEDIHDTAPAETRENLSLLQRRGARLEYLLSSLLDYSCVGRVKHNAELVYTAPLIAEIVEHLTPPPGFTVVPRGAMPVFRTDKPPFERVMRSLLANALKHHDRDTGTVLVSTMDLGDQIEFTVRDDGPGIDPAHHERIFVMFQTLKSCDEAESNGLGLAIVKKVVETHGGRIRVESEPPRRGAAFIFTWPKAER